MYSKLFIFVLRKLKTLYADANEFYFMRFKVLITVFDQGASTEIWLAWLVIAFFEASDMRKDI